MKGKLRSHWYLFIILMSLIAFGFVVARAAEGEGEDVYRSYLPNVVRNLPYGFSISGQVLNPSNVPVAGVTVRLDNGQTTVTDAGGNYSLLGLSESDYTITPLMNGVTFSPPSAAVVVPPNAIRLNFTAILACSEAIVNGGFEDNSGWEIPVTEYPAAYSTAEAHGGARSMRTGIVNPADNRYSYSSARQQITIPAGTTSAVLSFWLKPMSGEVLGGELPPQPGAGQGIETVPLAGDVQYVLILDQYGNIIDTLIWELTDPHIWIRYEFNLTEYAGRTIKVHFGTYNDGLGGVSAMYVDDVSFQLCPGGGSPTPTPTPGPCNNLLYNPSFEYVGYWDIPITRYPANYATAQAHTGSQSMRTGIVVPGDNTYSYSDFRQMVSIPAGSANATARFWLYTLSGEARGEDLPPSTPTGRPFDETVLANDLQYVLILDRYQNWIDTLVWQRSDEGAWHYYEFDLRRYAGQSIYLQFGTYNDGYSGITAMYVDDVSLDNCIYTPTPTSTPSATNTPTVTPTPTNTPPPTATPTITLTPGPCTELIVNSNFESNSGWVIIITEYPAGYSYARYHSAVRSMRTGIVLPGDNRYSYSDFRQTVSIPLSANNVTLGMWLYSMSSEAPYLPIPPQPQTTQFGFEPLASDVQYLLVLDQYGNWIDTLLWQRNNSQVWTYVEIDLSDYAGWVISLQWGTYNDGYDGITAMYVDDVTLQACP